MSTGIPLQQDCDVLSPQEHALWALIGLPGPGKNAPMVLPPSVLRQWSEHLWECGFRHQPDLQEIKYVPPASQQSWMAGAAGRWVNKDMVLPAKVTAPDISGLSQDEKRVLLERLAAEVNQAPPEEPTDTAEVSDG
ncbi:DUF2744 domain-containing protein [Corynebacteriaceae bacterium 6-324]